MFVDTSSSSMSTEIENLFVTRLFQISDESPPYSIPSSRLMIRIGLFKITGSRPKDNPRARTFDGPAHLVKYKTIVIERRDFLLASSGMRKLRPAKMLANILTTMEISEDKHRNIIDQIFRAVATAQVGPPLLCHMGDVSLRVIRTRSVKLECLEKVRLDSLEETARQEECVICTERIDHHFEDVEEGQLMITRLPCRHLYHGDCIVKWSEESYKCPLCRVEIPTIEVAPVNPVTPPGWRIVIACVIAAMMLC